MITYVVGDLFTSPAKVLVNTVNTVGVMGKGIARDFKRIYPEMFQRYQYYCEHSMLDIGKLWLYKSPHKWILNFPTKKHWRNRSKTDYIEAGLQKFVDTYDSKGIVSISFPMLGCGNGELDWESQVHPLMDTYLRPLPIDIYVHLYSTTPDFVPEHRNIKEIRRWLRSEPRDLPFSEFWDDVVALSDSSRSYRSIDDSIHFRVSTDPLGLSLQFDFDTDTFHVPKEQFQDLWTHIRPSGYYRVADLDFETPTHDRLIAGFLQHLPYIRPIQLSYRPGELEWDLAVLSSSLRSERESTAQVLRTA